jgi:hypothetical protein
VERETGILTEVDTYNWIAFLPMSDGTGAYNRYDKQKNTIKELLLNIQDEDLIGVDGTVRDRSPRDKRIMPCIQGGR